MPKVDTKHPEYARRLPQWAKCRDVAEGEDVVKQRGAQYLPRLDGMDNNDFTAYTNRASFYAATSRTIAGLSGAILRKEPELAGWPEKEQFKLETVGLQGESFRAVMAETVEEVLRVGRLGILVDAPAEGEGEEPYVVSYKAEHIVNWRTDTGPDGRLRLIMVVLYEEVQDWEGDDPFEPETVKQYRVLWLTRKGAKGLTEEDIKEPYYHQEVWQEVKGRERSTKEQFKLVDQTIPKQSGGRLIREIPFVVVNDENLSATPSKPPLLDLVNVNLGHYRNSADLEHGLHYVALPTPWLAGFKVEGKLRIGSGVAWTSKDSEARAGMLEFSGAGLESIDREMEKKEARMAAIGARLLEQQKPGVEAADTVRLRHAGESSALSRIAGSVSLGLTKVLRWLYAWSRPDAENIDEVAITLNDDFNIIGLSPQELEKLMVAVQSGLMSWDTWAYNLTRGELLPDGVSAEDEKELIRQGLPSPNGIVDVPDDAPEEDPDDDDESEEDDDEDA